jgi:hypothetical protein
MKEKLSLPTGVQTFADIIKRKSIYVDKTNYIEKMIDSGRKTFFLTRPRRFGKSLTVSTLESLFSGDKELFRGLAIENRLNNKNFASRPIIHLDMSSIVTQEGYIEFRNALARRIAFIAELLKIDVSKDMPPSEIFHDLIIKCSIKNKNQVAILIDEYDTPLTNNLDQINDLNKIRIVLYELYKQLKICDQYISFVFVTGITKNIQNGLYSAFNNAIDISYSTEFGGLTGFTHDEIKLNFKPQLKELAEANNITQKQLLDKMNNYYNGFCFDGETMLYNPFSTLLLFENNEFTNFWYNSQNPEPLISFLNENQLTIERFRGVSIDRERLLYPRQDLIGDPEVYLYQLGYLSQRPAPSSETVILDYPNAEVRGALARNLLESYLNSAGEAQNISRDIRKALINSNRHSLVEQFDILLASNPYNCDGKSSFDEVLYCELLYTVFYTLGLDPHAEKASHLRRSDVIVTCGGQTWVLGVKINHEKDGEVELAMETLKRLFSEDYGGTCENPVIMGLVLDEKARAVTAWASPDELGRLEQAWCRPPRSYAKKPPEKKTPASKPVGRP